MRIKYILLHKPLSLPGQGTGNKWSATGTDGRATGIVRSITESAKGYLLEIAVGPHKGIYEIMSEGVQFACLEPDPIAPPLADLISGAQLQANQALARLASQQLQGINPLYDRIKKMESVKDGTTVVKAKPQRNTKPPKA